MLYVRYMKIVLTVFKVFFVGLKGVFFKFEALHFVKHKLNRRGSLPPLLRFGLKKYFMFSKKQGFSFIELIATVSIVMVVSGVAIVSYNKFNKNAYITAGKVDLSEVRKVLQYMHSADGAYHPKIYSAGYRMESNYKSFAGFPKTVQDSDVNCNLFPQSKADLDKAHSRYFTLSKNSFDTGTLHAQTNSFEMCKVTAGCDLHGLGYISLFHVFDNTPQKQNCSIDFSHITHSRAITPYCDSYTYGIRLLTPAGKPTVLLTDETGAACMFEEDGDGIDMDM